MSSVEQKRLSSLRRYQILDSFPEERFERLARLAANIFGTPVAMISLLDEDRQWFKSHIGVDVCQTPLNQSICAHAVQQPSVLVVPDARQDARFAELSVVTGEPFTRFYAGAPLITPTGERIGTLCVIDTLPRRPLQETEKAILTDLAAVVIDELELGLAWKRLAAQQTERTNTLPATGETEAELIEQGA